MGVVNEDTCDTTMRTGLGLMTVFLGLATVAQVFNIQNFTITSYVDYDV